MQNANHSNSLGMSKLLMIEWALSYRDAFFCCISRGLREVSSRLGVVEEQYVQPITFPYLK